MCSRKADISFNKKEKGYRYAVDPFLLADFVDTQEFRVGLDAGTGNGIIAILLAALNPNLNMVAVELQNSLAVEAKKNVALNNLEKRVEVIEADLANCKSEVKGASFDFVVGNPPYRRNNDGRINKDSEEAIACHEIKVTLKEYIATCSRAVLERGKVSIIYHPYRLSELIAEMLATKLTPSRLRFVHSNPESEALMVMVEAVKVGNNDMLVMPPLYIYDSAGEYTQEMVGIYSKFGFEAKK